jgi:predicted CXXCH cytochrome family protein
MKHLYKAGLTGLLVLFLCGNAFALQLIYPLDATYVTTSKYLIVKGGTDPLLSGLTIEINGVKSDLIDISLETYRAAFGDMLVVEPSFDPGKNRIIVEGYLGEEKMASVTATIYYHDRYDQAPPADFTQEIFHYAKREEACVGCHNMTPSAAELANPDPGKNPCGSCHARMLDQAHVHGPAGVYECTYCHALDSMPNKYQARPGDAALCMECHEDKLEEYRKASFVHGPVEAGLCMVCHNPHASDQRSQLIMPAYELCASCHERVAKQPHVSRGSGGRPHPLKDVVNPVGNGENLSCASCHDPHAAASSAMFRWGIESRMSLCGKCHKK